MAVTYREVEGTARKTIDSLFGVERCLIEVNPGACLLPSKYEEMGQRIYDMEVRPDDVWVVSYPRTGSTWTQEMVWLLCNDLDFDKAKSALGQTRNPLLELTALIANDKGSWKDGLGHSVDQVENMPSPRMIKTHLPRTLLPHQLFTVKPKIIYVTRNPKDMCVSYYHYSKLLHDYHGTLEQFVHLFLDDKAPVGPFMSHVLGFWELRDEPNILFMKYEDMKKDHRGTIKTVAQFLDKELSEEQVTLLEDNLSFQKMRENPAVNLELVLQAKNGPSFKQEGDQTFIRKGQVGDWRNYLSDDTSVRFDKWIKENLEGTGLSFQTTVS